MIQQQMLELFRRHAPELGEPELRSRLQDASDLFCEETHILWGQWSFQTTPNQMYYDLDDRCAAVDEVNYDGGVACLITNVHNILIGR